jgi:N-acetylmuramoyl-L-alanine amidase
MDSAEAALERLTDPAARVSAHYLIDEKGNIYQMVDEEKRAWHAGISSWLGKDDVNSRSIGIEISNRNGDPYTKEQLFSVTLLCKDIMHRHGIKPENVIGHSDVAPDRKQDPGEHFPWEKLSRHDIGVWPKPSAADAFNAAAVARSPKKLKELFNKAGYGVNAFGKNKPRLKEIITAFQRHFEPEVFSDDTKKPGRATADTVAKLRALARLREDKPPAP